MSISKYFLQIKSICAKISELYLDENISDVRLQQFLIQGLKEYIPFVTYIQGWVKQPSIEELEIFFLIKRLWQSKWLQIQT